MTEAVNSKKPVVIIALITAVCIIGNEMLFIVMPIYWEFFGLTSLWQVGIILSANRIIRIPINPAVGWFYKKVNKRTGILIAVILAIISTFAYGTIKGFWPLIFMRILWGIAWSLLRLGGYLTVISCSNKQTNGHLIGVYNGLWGLGTLIAMLIGGLLTEIVGIQIITIAFSILAILTIPFVILYVPNSPSETETTGKSKTSILTSKNHIRMLGNGLVIAFVTYGIFSSTLSKIIEYQIEDTVSFFSISIGAVAIAGIIQAIRLASDPFIAPLIGKWSDQGFRRIQILIIGLLFGTICLFLIPFKFPFPLFLIVILIFQLMATLLITSSDSLAIDLSNGPSSLKAMIYYTLFVDLGSALGPLISFFVLDFLGIKWLYWITSLILFIVFIYWCQVYREENRSASNM